jgi:ADP-heptose:LPS heptosyltransferase
MPSQPPSRSAHAPAPRVLVIRRRYLGDVVLLGSLFRNIRLQWPEAHIAVLTEPAYIGALTLNPDVNAAIPLPASHQVAALTALAWRLWQSRFTHVIDVDNTDKTALLAFSSGAPIRVTYNRETGGTHFRWAYSRYADLGDAFYATHHITETYLVLLEPMGIEVRTRDVRLVPRLEDLAAIGPLLPAATAGQRRVLVHPGSRSPYRIWPVERFASVCDRIQRELGATVLVVAGPGEQELGRQIRAQMETPVAAIPRRIRRPRIPLRLVPVSRQRSDARGRRGGHFGRRPAQLAKCGHLAAVRRWTHCSANAVALRVYRHRGPHPVRSQQRVSQLLCPDDPARRGIRRRREGARAKGADPMTPLGKLSVATTGFSPLRKPRPSKSSRLPLPAPRP